MSKNMAMTEAQAMILERLIEAMETDIALPVRIGPKAFGSSMPEYVHSAAEVFANEREDIAETRGQRTASERKAARLQLERRQRCSPSRISRMEEAFGWVRQYIFDDEARQILLAYAEVKARGWDWSRYLNTRNRKYPQKKAWVKRTVQRWIVRNLPNNRGALFPERNSLAGFGGFTGGPRGGKTSGQIDNIRFACVVGA